MMYLLEREHNTGWGKKIRFNEQKILKNGDRTIKPRANNGIEMKVNRDFALENEEYFGEIVTNRAINDKNYNQFYRYIVNRFPDIAYFGAYREYKDWPIESKTIKIKGFNGYGNFESFLRTFEEDLNTKNELLD